MMWYCADEVTGSYHALERQVVRFCNNGVTESEVTDPAYNAFTRYGHSSSWCKAHALSFRAMSRAISIRGQLKKYMQRFGLPLDSCQGDAKRLRQCLVSGYWRNGARWVADGTYRSVRGNVVRMHGACFQELVSDLKLGRLCMCIPTPCFSRENPGRDGSYSMRWKRRKRHSLSRDLCQLC